MELPAAPGAVEHRGLPVHRGDLPILYALDDAGAVADGGVQTESGLEALLELVSELGTSCELDFPTPVAVVAEIKEIPKR